jgi:hypothetical protein
MHGTSCGFLETKRQRAYICSNSVRFWSPRNHQTVTTKGNEEHRVVIYYRRKYCRVTDMSRLFVVRCFVSSWKTYLREQAEDFYIVRNVGSVQKLSEMREYQRFERKLNRIYVSTVFTSAELKYNLYQIRLKNLHYKKE